MHVLETKMGIQHACTALLMLLLLLDARLSSGKLDCGGTA
jgi:hypothetical protein